VREERGGYVVGFDALGTPEQAAAFRDGFIKIPRVQSPPLPEGQFYERDLVGMTVVDEAGAVLGELEEVLDTGANHVFVVRRDGRETLIPAIRAVVASVDVTGRTMTVRWDQESRNETA
jgi:16S rRNA processing protein RimM